MPESMPPLRARTIEADTFTRLQGWERQGPHWLVIYATSATDGVVWVSTEAADGAANAAATVPDRRPLTVPASFYLGPYDVVAIAISSGQEGSTVTCEVTPHPVQPVRMEPAGVTGPARCER